MKLKKRFRPLKHTGIPRCGEMQLLKDNGFRLATLTNSPSCAKAAVNQFKFNRLF
jgi:hypothetical protein